MSEKVILLGAGPVGSLMACYLSMAGYEVSLYEKRSDMRKSAIGGGRSINLALSNRGLKPLDEIGIGDEVKKLGIPMKGRMMHDIEGKLTFQSYGKKEEAIHSVSRSELNKFLMSEAERKGVSTYFDHECTSIDFDNTTATFLSNGKSVHCSADYIIGADGAFSSMRQAMKSIEGFEEITTVLEHGYKELTILPKNNDFAMDKHCLHIWPRNKFMLIALPNLDQTFTCTLFFPLKGELSFESITSDQDINDFFTSTFGDAVPLMPNLVQDYHLNPTSKLITIQCYPWSVGNTLMIGDASHAIVPFYGQGMNSGFEDCRVLNKFMKDYSLSSILEDFQKDRKPNADAIRELALKNFVEMRDLVGDPKFLLRKKIEAKLNELYPDSWIPLYSMVTFSHIPYSDALKIGKKHDQIMNEVMETPGINENWENLDFKSIIEKLSL